MRVDIPVDSEAGGRVELMLVTAATTVIVVRAFLAATGYPKIGGDGLHIAHLLWGGLGLGLATVILLSVIGRRAAVAAAVLAGVGFGLFVDEIGKFVTADNDYFYKPAIGLIYLVFIGLALLLRLVRSLPLSDRTAVANALVLLADAQRIGLDGETRERILGLVAHAPADDAMGRLVREGVAAMDARPTTTTRLRRVQARLSARYERIALSRAFIVLLIAGTFLAIAFEALALAVYLDLGAGSLTRLELLALGANALTTAAALAGIWNLARHRRLKGLVWLRTAAVASLLLGEPLAFWESEMAALPGFVMTLFVYGALGYAVRRERALVAARARD